MAIDWNWDAGLDVLAWIAAQLDCGPATAQYLVLNGGADCCVHYADRTAPLAQTAYNVQPFDFLLCHRKLDRLTGAARSLEKGLLT